jgi:hypothetical protein
LDGDLWIALLSKIVWRIIFLPEEETASTTEAAAAAPTTETAATAPATETTAATATLDKNCINFTGFVGRLHLFSPQIA